MGTLFCNPKSKEQISDQDRAIYNLKLQRDKFMKTRVQYEQRIQREKEIALALMKQGKKDRAKLVMRKKKHQENLLEKTENLLINIEQLVTNIEFSKVQNQVFSALSEGNEVLKEINKEITIENVEQLMEESAEAIAYQQEVSAAMSKQLTHEDDEAIIHELEQIESSTIHEELPAVPVKPLPITEENENKVEIKKEKPVVVLSV